MAKRPRHKMPADVAQAIRVGGVMADYTARPAYQQNDYIGWIARAAEDATRAKRLAQMIVELNKGGVYMNMAHAPSRKGRA